MAVVQSCIWRDRWGYSRNTGSEWVEWVMEASKPSEQPAGPLKTRLSRYISVLRNLETRPNNWQTDPLLQNYERGYTYEKKKKSIFQRSRPKRIRRWYVLLKTIPSIPTSKILSSRWYQSASIRGCIGSSIRPSIHLSVCPGNCPSVRPFFHPSILPSYFRPSIYQ